MDAAEEQLEPRVARGGGRFIPLLKLGVSVALLAALLSQVEWSRALGLLAGADAAMIVALLVLHTADRLLMAVKWHQLLRVLDERPTRLDAIRVYYESTFVGFAMPLGGLGPDIVRFVRLRRRGIEPHVTLVSILAERLIGLIATALLVAAGLAALAHLSPNEALRDFALGGAAVSAAGALIAAVALFLPAARRLAAGWLARGAIADRLNRAVRAAQAYAGRRRLLAANLGLSVVEQTAAVWAYWIGSRALDTPLPLLVCLAVAPVTVVIQRLPVSYAGLGLREGGAAALLVALGYGYSEAMVLLMLLFAVFSVSLLPGVVVFRRSPHPYPDRLGRRLPLGGSASHDAPTAAAPHRLR